MSHHLATYPRDEQYERWKKEADARNMSMAEFAECMIEAGLKKFEINVTPDESAAELREQRNDLRDELTHARSRIEKLEQQMYTGERGEILRFIEENGPVGYADIIGHLNVTANQRVVDFLERCEGEAVERVGDQFTRLDSEDFL